MSANSMNLDYVFGFEAKYLNCEKIKNEVLPANRGNRNYFGDCPWHYGLLFTTDMPTSKSGQWILEKEKAMDADLINLIKITYFKYKNLTSKKTRRQTLQQLNFLRSTAVFYAEYDAFDNIEIPGESIFVKTPRKIKDVVNDFCDYYSSSPNKDVIYFYDSTAVADTPTDALSFADTVISQLHKRGFSPIPVFVGQPLRYHLRHLYIDLGFKGDPNYLFPSFNQDNNEYLILAMENTGIIIGKSGFEKDKRAEKTPDSPENPDELKTHITDAWDTLYVGMNFHYPSSANSSLVTKFPL